MYVRVRLFIVGVEGDWKIKALVRASIHTLHMH